jgi:hypothetical protein
MSRPGNFMIVATLLLSGLTIARLTSAASPMRTPAALFVAQSRAEKAHSPQEERRRKLLEEMGLRKQDQPPPDAAAVPAPRPTPDASAPGTPDDKPGAPHGLRPTGLPAAPSFRRTIHPLLLQTCKVCHVAGGPAAMTPFLLSGEAGPDHGAVLRVVDRRAPAASTLLAKVSGQKPHAGGAPWPAGGPAYGRVLAWVQAGAHLDGANPDPAANKPSSRPLAPNAPAAKLPRPPSPKPADEVDAIATVEAPPPTTESEVPPPPVTPDADGMGGAIDGGVGLAADFAAVVHPLLVHACAACHSPAGPAAATRLILSGEVDSDYTKVRALVTPKTPALSPLITKGAGEGHAGGAVVVPGSAASLLLLNWVAAGAARHAASAVAQSGPSAGTATSIAGAPTPATTEPRSSVIAVEAIAAHPSGAAAAAGLALPYGIAINGRFDVAYERRGFSGDPTDGAAVDALRSYHHFLFLTRESADDPIGLAIEMLTLQFWEAHYRWRAKHLPIEVTIAAGKLIVPFGAEPLMHQSYGGLAGFDQRILPAIWAQHGLAVRAIAHRRELAITDDFYVVRGYALRQADGIINLQNDFSSEDDARLGWGNRLGAAWGPLSGWYSIYYNPLGFERRLVMQAVDVMLWRLRQVPVLGHFSFAAGLMRADVSGGDSSGTGGPGRDYYHFGSYFQLRYHPTDWLYLQYRQGLRTFNNRRGVIVDDTRLTSDDGSTHNFGAVARYRGLAVGLYYFINLEKADEVPDDFLRASVTYEF